MEAGVGNNPVEAGDQADGGEPGDLVEPSIGVGEHVRLGHARL